MDECMHEGPSISEYQVSSPVKQGRLVPRRKGAPCRKPTGKASTAPGQTGFQVAVNSIRKERVEGYPRHIPGAQGSSPVQRGTDLLGFGSGEKRQKVRAQAGPGIFGGWYFLSLPILWGLSLYSEINRDGSLPWRCP